MSENSRASNGSGIGSGWVTPNPMVGAALALSLALALFTPLYSDEIGWRFQLARSVFDGGVDRYIAPGCASPLIAAPWFVQPLRFASAWGNALVPDPAMVRVLGVSMALAIVALLLVCVRRAKGSPTLLLGALGLGLLPFLLVWSRPEQPILLCLASAVAIGLWRSDPSIGPDLSIGKLRLANAAIVLLAVVALGYHLKAVFYLPVFLAAIWLAIPGTRARWSRALASGAVLAAAAAVYPYWSIRFRCPGDPLVAATHRAENLGASLAGPGLSGAGGHFDAALLARALSSAGPDGYIAQVLPGWVHMSDWIASTHMPGPIVGVWRSAVALGWWGLLLAGGIALIAGIVAGWRTRTADPRIVLAAALAVSLLGWAIAQLNDNAYESMLWLPLAALSSVLALAVVEGRVRHVTTLAKVIGIIAVASQLLLWIDYARLIPAAHTPGFVAGQPYSLNPFGYDRAAILAAGRRCGIAPRAPGVVVDDWTYFAYQRSYRPIYAIGVFGRWRGRIGDPLAYLRANGSPGVVAACSSLPAPLRDRARRSGTLCCLAIR